jgi:tetratricopeptide (TPR) repeat protein
VKKNSRKKIPGKTSADLVTETGAGRRFQHLLPVLFLTVATFLAYAVSLNGTWAFDDTAIGQYASVENALNLHLGYRKIAYLSFLVNRWIDPISPINYRVTNILIHICNVLLVYTIALKTLGLPGWKDKYGEYRFSVGLLAATIFALHPININAVSYIVQRMASLAAMFVLLALLCYLNARASRSATRAPVLYVLAGACVLLGIFSKENAVMAVPLIVLYDFMFLRVPGAKRFSIKSVAVAGAGLLLLGSAAVVLQFHKAAGGLIDAFLHPFRPIAPQNWTAIDVYWTPLQHVLTECRIVARYLFLILLPLPRFLVFDWWGFPVSKGLTEPATTVLSLFLIGGLVAFCVRKRRKFPFLSFGLLWYFIALSLESFIAVGSDLYFEHRNYLPLAGLTIGVAAQAVVILAAEAPKRRTVWAAACVLALLLGGLTFQRNLVWKDSVTLWKDTVDKTKGNLRAMVALGNSYLDASDLKSAKRWYREAAGLSATDGRAGYLRDSLYSLGMVDLFMGDLPAASKVIDTMNKKLEGSYTPRIVEGFYRSLNGDYDGAIQQFDRVLPSTVGLDKVIVYTLLGDAFSKKGVPARAIENYKVAIRLDPSFAAAYYGLGTTYLGMRDLKKAEEYIVKTLVVDPLNPLALADMADIQLIKKEPPEKAERLASRAIAQSPVPYPPYLTMGNVLIVMGREQAAEEFYRKAVEHGAKDYLIPFSKARAYYLKGDREKVKFFTKEVLSMKDTPAPLKRSLGGAP